MTLSNDEIKSILASLDFMSTAYDNTGPMQMEAFKKIATDAILSRADEIAKKHRLEGWQEGYERRSKDFI